MANKKQPTLIDRCIRNDSGRLTLLQSPNLPLIVWFVSMLLARVDGKLGDIADVISFGALFTWAWLELFSGTNYFRRALGLGMLVVIISNRI